MREITYKAYQFKELSDKAKEKALEWAHDLNTDHDWWEGVYDMWYEKLEAFGFTGCKIWFSGFWSQGDGGPGARRAGPGGAGVIQRRHRSAPASESILRPGTNRLALGFMAAA